MKNEKPEKPMKNPNDGKPQDGLDQWNDRLDENLEPKAENDPQADDKAKDYHERNDRR